MSVEVLVIPKRTKAMRVSSPLGDASHVCCQSVCMHYDLSICLISSDEACDRVISLTRVILKGEIIGMGSTARRVLVAGESGSHGKP